MTKFPGDSTAIKWVLAVARAQGKRAAVWNPQEGCSPKGEGCRNCWAAREVHMRAGQGGAIGKRFGGLTRKTAAGRIVFNGNVREIERDMDKPRRTVAPTAFFVCSRSDLFGRETNPELRDRILDVAADERRHTFLILTKEPLFMAARLSKAPTKAHIWLGATVWDQASADRARTAMEALATTGWRTWVSYEPAIGPVDWTGWHFLDWMVAGGESGPGARTPHGEWFRKSRDYCRAWNIAFNLKQWGKWSPIWAQARAVNVDPATGKTDDPNAYMGPRGLFVQGPNTMFSVGVKAAGRTLDGQVWAQVPA